MRLLLALACAVPPHRGEVVARVAVSDPADLELLEALGGDLWSEHVLDAADVRLNRRALERLQLPYTLLIDDLEAAIAHGLLPAGPGFHEEWHALDEILDRLDVLDAQGGDDALIYELGASLEGRPIRGLEIRTGPADGRPGILITGTQHAREWIAAASALWIAERLVDGLGTDPEVEDLLDRYKVFVVPVVNPDGYDFTWTTDRLWRKNRRPNGDGSVGVDLNRNWAAGFGGPGSSGSGGSMNYRGAAPFSEPETAAVRDWLGAHPRYAVHVDLHSTGQLVLSPWGFSGTPSPDADLLDGAGLLAADAMALHEREYAAGPVYSRLYPASGVAIDWSYGAHGLNSWLLELRDRGQYGFLLPADQIVPTAEEAWQALLTFADQPAARFDLQPDDALLAGAVGTLSAWRAVPGARVEVYGTTTGTGSTVLQDGTALELDDAALLGSAVAGPAGRADVEVYLLAEWAGETLTLQATDGTGRSVVRAETIPW